MNRVPPITSIFRRGPNVRKLHQRPFFCPDPEVNWQSPHLDRTNVVWPACYNIIDMANRGNAAPPVLTLTALIVDDEALARDELAYLLKDFPDVEIAATAANGLEAIDLIERIEPDLVFLDVQMPGLDGLGLIR